MDGTPRVDAQRDDSIDGTDLDALSDVAEAEGRGAFSWPLDELSLAVDVGLSLSGRGAGSFLEDVEDERSPSFRVDAVVFNALDIVALIERAAGILSSCASASPFFDFAAIKRLRLSMSLSVMRRVGALLLNASICFEPKPRGNLPGFFGFSRIALMRSCAACSMRVLQKAASSASNLR